LVVFTATYFDPKWVSPGQYWIKHLKHTVAFAKMRS